MLFVRLLLCFATPCVFVRFYMCSVCLATTLRVLVIMCFCYSFVRRAPVRCFSVYFCTVFSVWVLAKRATHFERSLFAGMYYTSHCYYYRPRNARLYARGTFVLFLHSGDSIVRSRSFYRNLSYPRDFRYSLYVGIFVPYVGCNRTHVFAVSNDHDRSRVFFGLLGLFMVFRLLYPRDDRWLCSSVGLALVPYVFGVLLAIVPRARAVFRAIFLLLYPWLPLCTHFAVGSYWCFTSRNRTADLIFRGVLHLFLQ